MSDTTFARTFPFDRLQAKPADRPRRTTHGSGGWTLPSSLGNLRQPQDGALTEGISNASVAIRPNERSNTKGVEAEDARLNGTLRSLARRVTGLNVMSARPSAKKNAVETVIEPMLRKAPEPNRKIAANRTQVA
jgi:hypothetical protein